MATQPGEVLTLSASERDELDDLRRRGYGPGDGLSAASADRLRTLEERALDRQVQDAGQPAGVPEAAASPPSVEQRSDLETGPRRAPDAPADSPPPSRRGLLRHPIVLALAGLAAGALLVGLGFALAQPPVSVDAGSLEAVTTDRQKAAVVLGTASFSVRNLDPDSLVQYASLGQGTPWSASRPDGGRCLILTVTDDSPEMIAAAGIWDVACAPPGLAPIIDWAVDRSYPSPPQTLPEGSVVRLTLDDERVRLSIGRSG